MKTALRLLMKTLLWLGVAWIALIALIVTPALNIVTDDLISDATGREFHSGVLLVNPIGFAVSAEALSLADRDGEPLLSVPKVLVDLDLWGTLLRPGVTVARLRIEGLEGQLRRRADGSLTIDDLIASQPESEPDQQPPVSPPPPVLVQNLSITVSELAFADASHPGGFRNALRNLTLAASDIGTHHGAGATRLQLQLASGGRLAWEGDLDLEGSRVSGRASLTDLALPTWWAYLAADIPSELRRGQYRGDTAIALNWGNGLSGRITLDEHELNDLLLAPRFENPRTTGVQLAGFRLDGADIDLAARRVALAPVTVTGLDIATEEADGKISLVDMLVPAVEANTDAPVAAAAAGPAADPGDAAPGWQVSGAGIALERASVRILTDKVKPGQLVLSDLELSLGSVSWPEGVATPFALDTRINADASLAVTGDGNLLTGAIDLETLIDGLPLEWFEPLAAEQLNTGLTGGVTRVSLAASLDDFQPRNATAQVTIDAFHGQLPDASEPIGGFRQLRLEDIGFDASAKAVDIGEVHLTGANSTLRIRQDGTINASQIVKQTAISEGADQVEATVERVTEDDAEPWQVRIPAIFVYDSRLAFRDDSLPVQFTAQIEDLGGELRGFDTRPDTSMTVDLKGAVDGFAPVVIDGNLGHFSAPVDGALTMSMRGVDLARLTPYAATYAGYPIERGVMTVELDYQLDNGVIAGNNHVVVERLRLGDRTDSPDAADLPIKTAVALLTNLAGVIDVSLDVSGSPDDPEFDVFSALADAASNLIVNVVAAPFKLLASLAGEEDVPETVRFAAGSAELSETARGNLDILAQGLLQRPQILLLLNPQVDRELDRERLAREQLTSALVADGVALEAITNRGPAWEAAINARAEAAGLAAELSPIEKYNTLAAAMPISEDQLKQLASDRAAAVKAHLVNLDGFDPQRAVISQWDPVSDDFTGVTLDIDIR